jgi:hypothetical protein
VEITYNNLLYLSKQGKSKRRQEKKLEKDEGVAFMEMEKHFWSGKSTNSKCFAYNNTFIFITQL